MRPKYKIEAWAIRCLKRGLLITHYRVIALLANTTNYTIDFTNASGTFYLILLQFVRTLCALFHELICVVLLLVDLVAKRTLQLTEPVSGYIQANLFVFLTLGINEGNSSA